MNDKITAKEYVDPFKDFKANKKEQERQSNEKGPLGPVSKKPAIGESFSTPLGVAGNSPLQGLNMPPAEPAVMTDSN